MTSASCPVGSSTLNTDSPYYGSTDVQDEDNNKIATGSTSYSGDCSADTDDTNGCSVWTVTGSGNMQWSDTFHYAYHQVAEANIDARIFVKAFSGVEDSDVAGLSIHGSLLPWIYNSHFAVVITGTNKVQAWHRFGTTDSRRLAG